MHDDRRCQVDKIFHAALECDIGQRALFLDRACADDLTLRKEVEALIGSYEQSGSFLAPAAARAVADSISSQSGSLAGKVFGTYAMKALLGSEGMGEVYQARDSKLKRDVAIKVLPHEFSRDTERVARFEREAEMPAALNHPRIAAIYELARFGESQFLVMELVEGAVLDQRISAGPIPIAEALRIAKQIAEALEAGHEKGIIHRDLKPANIKVTPDGHVKVLNFGLAKMISAEGTALSNAPTKMTVSSEGTLLGTAAYMSPEQAKGKETDRSSDLWAFGCVLYEMLTGHPVFTGETVGEILEGIFKAEPNWDRLPAGTPERIRRLLRRCLHKDQKRRFRDIRDAGLEIEDIQTAPRAAPSQAAPAGQIFRSRWHRAVVPSGFVVLTLIAGAMGVRILRSVPAQPEVRSKSVCRRGRMR